MPLQASEILFRPAVAMGGASNGGVMGSSLIAPSAENAVFPDVRESERTSGSTMHRKVFIHFVYADNVSAALDVMTQMVVRGKLDPEQVGLLILHAQDAYRLAPKRPTPPPLVVERVA